MYLPIFLYFKIAVYFLLHTYYTQETQKEVSTVSIDTQCLPLSINEPSGTRTQDPQIKSLMLYQLS